MKDFESLTVISVEYYCTVHLSRNVSINIECLLFLLLGVMIKDGAIRWFTNCSDLSVLDVCSVNSLLIIVCVFTTFRFRHALVFGKMNLGTNHLRVVEKCKCIL